MPFPAGFFTAHGRAAADAGVPPPRRRRRRSASIGIATICLVGTVLTVEGSSTRPAAASIGSDKTRIAQIEQEIEQEGELVQTLVTRSDEVEGKLQVVQGRIAVEKAQMAVEQRSDSAAHTKLGQVAIEAYASGGSFSVDWTSSSSIAASEEQGVYAGVADGMLDNALNPVELDERQLTITGVKLQSDQQTHTAINRDQQILSQVQGNLRQLVIQAAIRAEQARQAAEERAAEQAAAAAAAQAAAQAAAEAAAQAAAAAAA